MTTTPAPLSPSDRRTVTDVIQAFGGTAEFGRVIGKGQSTASEMKRCGRIDSKHWAAILAAARKRGSEFDWLTAEALAIMHAPPDAAAELAAISGAQQ